MDQTSNRGSIQRAWLIAKLFFYIAIPLTLLILPADFFDEGESVCLSVLLFDMQCYACGLTRAIMHLIHFDLSSAIYYNQLSLIVFPLLSFLWLKGFLKDQKQLRRSYQNT